jgi:putative nucleotidyltransferase with HDIG domain
MGITVLLEYGWNFVTPLRLFELSDPNSPLLRKMFETAPGTYQHSVMIANISSHAGEAIGLDPLLIRVGSYYHDIGKLPSAYSFTENSSGSNILDSLNPIEAAEKIKGHVTEGLVIANQYKLPKIVKDFIIEHHGTSRISFLFDAAKLANPLQTDDSVFRYPGPKPHSKETTIVMLADSVEAAIRSIDKKTFDNISLTVRNVIATKQKDNQLSESTLSFMELEKVTESFIFTLDSLYHARVSYALTNQKEEEKQ